MRSTILALALLAAGCGHSRPATVVFDAAAGGLADVYVADDPGPRPVVIALHSGAWQLGSRTDAGMQNVGRALAARGITVIAPSYSLAPSHVWPAPLDDCRTCIGFVSSAAQALRLDPSRVGVFGISAGGQLALMLAFTDERVRAVCSMDGESDLTQPDAFPDQERILATLFGGTPRPDQLRDASPIFHVKKDAHALLIHGAFDPLMNVAQSDLLDQALLSAGADVSYVRRDSSAHDSSDDPSVQEVIAAFFTRTLGG